MFLYCVRVIYKPMGIVDYKYIVSAYDENHAAEICKNTHNLKVVEAYEFRVELIDSPKSTIWYFLRTIKD